MSPPTARSRPAGNQAATNIVQADEAKTHDTPTRRQDPIRHAVPALRRRAAALALGTAERPRPTVVVEPCLFDVVRTPAPPGVPTRVGLVLPDEPDDQRRGPGPRPPTTGPQDASAPAWWTQEAERVVLALVASGHRVSSDDLHDRFPAAPSASGAAFGGLFARLSRAGRLVEVGMVRSRRPEARRRRIILWGAPDGAR